MRERRFPVLVACAVLIAFFYIRSVNAEMRRDSVFVTNSLSDSTIESLTCNYCVSCAVFAHGRFPAICACKPVSPLCTAAAAAAAVCDNDGWL